MKDAKRSVPGPVAGQTLTTRAVLSSLPVRRGDAHQRKVDVVFAIDTTGSMSSKIEGLLATCAQFATAFSRQTIDVQFAVVAFGDLTQAGDRIVKTAFMREVPRVHRTLQKIPRYGGGANEGESSFEALEIALALPDRSDALHIVLLITDEPALEHQISAAQARARVLGSDAIVCVVSPDIQYFRAIAEESGGKWFDIFASVSLADILAMFREVATHTSTIADRVFQLTDGDIVAYRQLRLR